MVSHKKKFAIPNQVELSNYSLEVLPNKGFPLTNCFSQKEFYRTLKLQFRGFLPNKRFSSYEWFLKKRVSIPNQVEYSNYCLEVLTNKRFSSYEWFLIKEFFIPNHVKLSTTIWRFFHLIKGFPPTNGFPFQTTSNFQLTLITNRLNSEVYHLI